MSLLNQMLRDLDRRGARPQHGMAPQAAVTVAQGRRGRSRRKVVWSAFALMLAAGFGLDAWLQREVQAAAQRPLPLGMRDFGAAIEPTVAVAAQAPVRAPAMPLAQDAQTTGATSAVSDSAHAPGAASEAKSSRAPSAAHIAATAPAERGTVTSPATATPAPKRNTVSPTAKPGTAAAVAAVAAPAPSTGAAPAESPGTTARNHAAPSAAAVAPPQRTRAGEAPGMVSRGEATASITPSMRPASDAALTRIADLINRGRSHEAMLALAQLLRAQPRHADARSTLAALQAERGQREAALLTLLEGAALDPQAFAAVAARLQADLGDVTGALATLERVPPALRDGPHLALEGGLALRALAPRHARDAYTRALAAPNADPLWWIGLALAHEALGDDSAARRAFGRAAAAPALPVDVRAFVNQRLAALDGTPAPAADAFAQQGSR